MDWLLIFLMLSIVVNGFMLARNDAVYRARLAILDVQPIGEALRLYDRLPNYYAMAYRPQFWLLWAPEHWLAWISRQEEQL